MSGEFLGVISGNGSVTVDGGSSATLTLGDSVGGANNAYTGGTDISGGMLFSNSGGAVPPQTALTMEATATFNVNGFGATLLTLNGDVGDTITNGATAAIGSTISVGQSVGLTPENFAGTIEDGTYPLTLSLLGVESLYVGNAYFSGGTTLTGSTQLTGSSVTFGGGYSVGFLASMISAASVTPGAASTVIFDVPSGTENFTGYITTSNSTLVVEETGPGTLSIDPLGSACYYTGLQVGGGGTVVLANPGALPPGGNFRRRQYQRRSLHRRRRHARSWRQHLRLRRCHPGRWQHYGRELHGRRGPRLNGQRQRVL